MDIRKVKKIMDLLEKSDVAEIEIHEGRNSIRISRIKNAPVVANFTLPNANNQLNESEVAIEKPEVIEFFNFTSPIVGTFYLSTSPTSSPLISVGQHINKGDTLCVIEAMKIMNKIEAERSGIIHKILCEDGDSIEFGQELIIFK